MVLVSDDYIEVIDLKYGKGVRVSAEKNSQMMLYALGLYNAYGDLYGAEKVRMTIIQPRIDNISTSEISVEELLKWGDEIKPIAAHAFRGAGERVAGDHCKFCKARATCRALADYELETVKEDMQPDSLTDIDISEIVRRADSIKKWLTSVEEYALEEALKGTKWPELKVVEGRSVRKISDDKKALLLLKKAGYKDTEILKPQELQTISALEKLIGKKKFSEVLGDVIIKPQGKPTLVPASDKRPEMELEAATENDFDDSLL
jgi:hypothetical protein